MSTLARARERVGRLRPRSLSHQLSLMLSLGMWLSLTGFAAWTFHAQSTQALRHIEDQATALARNVALSSEDPILTDRLDAIEAVLLQTANLPQVQEVRVTDAQGMSLSHVSRARGQSPVTVFDAPNERLALPASPVPSLAANTRADSVIAWQPIIAGNMIGWVRLEHGTESLQDIRQHIWQSTLVAAVLAGVVSVLLLSAWLRQPLRAIERAKDFALTLTRNDGQQIAIIEGPEETIALSRALNQASARLFEQRQTIDDGVAALRQHEAALARTNEQLSTIFALSPDALVSFDTVDRVQFANEAFYRMTGLKAEDLMHQPSAVLDQHLRTHSIDAALYPGLGAYFTQQAGAPASAPRTSLRLTLARPHLRVLELVGLLSQAPSISRLLYIRDVTHESEIERMKNEFLRTAAHELRTPMTSINACVELLLLREYDAPRRAHLLNIMHRQNAAMINIVSELLDLARMESQRGEDFEFQTVAVTDLIREAVGRFVPPNDRAAPILHLDGLNSPVRVDTNKVAQIVRHVLSNAYKFSSTGDIHLRLLPVRLAENGPTSGAFAGFEVQDQGIGMSADQVARVCERFYRADTTGHLPGTGLGMSIVKEIVTLMRGEVAITSTLGSGTTVSVWLHMAEPDDLTRAERSQVHTLQMP